MKLPLIFVLAVVLGSAAIDASPVKDAVYKVAIAKRPSTKSHRERVVAHRNHVTAKYRMALSDGLERRSSAALTNYVDNYYTAPVTVGKNQKFTLDLDTGSSDTDSTLTDMGTPFDVKYGSGSVHGNVFKGPLAMGGLSSKIAFGVSYAETGMNGTGMDGLMGLGFSRLSAIGRAGVSGNNWMDALKLSTNVIGFYLSNSVDGDKGEVTIGGVDSSKFSGPFTYIPLISGPGYWQASFAGATFSAGSASGKLVGNTKTFIADTGTTQIILDTAPANAINKAIGAGAYDENIGANPIACSVATTGPDVNMNFGGGSFVIPASTYVVSDGEGGCFSGFVGDAFQRNYYTVYDKSGTGRIGYAKAVHPGGQITTTVTSTTTTATKTTTLTTITDPLVNQCAHPICTVGVKLEASCDPCAKKIINQDPYCGSTGWDTECVGEVKSICKHHLWRLIIPPKRKPDYDRDLDPMSQ
ncbi:Vacuolar protease A [Irineochytrium annulatum]|nr:Vacuolar protease A [Irineochytrium annulatum]